MKCVLNICHVLVVQYPSVLRLRMSVALPPPLPTYLCGMCRDKFIFIIGEFPRPVCASASLVPWMLLTLAVR